jgi:hypothetical protein
MNRQDLRNDYPFHFVNPRQHVRCCAVYGPNRPPRSLWQWLCRAILRS